MGTLPAAVPGFRAGSRAWAATTGSGAHRRVVWSLWLVCLVALLTFAPALHDPTVLDVAEDLSWTIGILAVATIGALVVTKRRSFVPGWLLMTFALLLAVGIAAHHVLEFPGIDAAARLERSRWLIAFGDSLIAVGIHTLFLLLIVVPDGRLPSPRWRPVLWVLAASAALEIWTVVDEAQRIVDVDAWLGRVTWTSTAGLRTTPIDAFFEVAGVLSGLLVIGLVIRALWSRLADGRMEVRQQVKWVIWGSSGVALWVLIWLPQPDGGWLVSVQRLYPACALGLLATGFGMALFKYRLWDIDLVVRRSLVYGVLWLLIAAVYASVAAGLGLAAGARLPLGAAISLTVAATVVFQPARRFTERAADRWVFGRKGSAVDAMQTFGEGVSASAHPGDVASQLARTATRALGLAWVAVEIDGSPPTELGTSNAEPEVVLSLEWGHETFGVLRGQANPGFRVSRQDVALLEALVGQAALAMSHARLASRVVHAQEEERRRIERNIHDGAQQDLATLMVRLGVTRARANGDSGLAEALGHIQHEIERILVELRELAQGIHPSVLRDGGLVAAIEDRCSRLPIEVNLEVDRALRDRRLTDDVEAAAYFFTTEAVANTLKHSGSSTVDIAIHLYDDQLKVEVTDAGVGFRRTDLTAGSGIAGLADRIRAVGGRMTVDSGPHRGTILVALLPVSGAIQVAR